MVPVSALGILAAVVWLAVGVVVFSCFWTNLVLLAFWTRSIEPINDVAAGVRTAGQYPLDYFPAWARALFVTVAPAGLLAAVPSEQLMASTWPVLAAVPAATAAVTLTAWHWRSGLRHYESASS
ncbi:ABC-2 family transporter protein [Salana multivorans]